MTKLFGLQLSLGGGQESRRLLHVDLASCDLALFTLIPGGLLFFLCKNLEVCYLDDQITRDKGSFLSSSPVRKPCVCFSGLTHQLGFPAGWGIEVTREEGPLLVPYLREEVSPLLILSDARRMVFADILDELEEVLPCSYSAKSFKNHECMVDTVKCFGESTVVSCLSG